MCLLYEIAQWLVVLLWLPFTIVEKAAYWTMRAAKASGDALVRPIYYNIVQAKRRHFGEPLWQQHDWQIGIAPPCEYCGVQVPPGRHLASCAFLRTSVEHLTMEQIARLAKSPSQSPCLVPGGALDLKYTCHYCKAPTNMPAYVNPNNRATYYPSCCNVCASSDERDVDWNPEPLDDLILKRIMDDPRGRDLSEQVFHYKGEKTPWEK